MIKHLFLFVCAFSACGGSVANPSDAETSKVETSKNPPSGGKGTAAVVVSMASATTTVSGVSIAAQPANTTQALTPDANGDGGFTGALVLPAGQEMLTATATDTNGNVIGSGTATVTVAEGVVSAVALTIIGTPEAQIAILPILTSVTVSTVTPTVGESVDVSATAVDVNGNSMSYAWISTCADGTFADATAAATTWSKATIGACTLTVTATSAAGATSQNINVAVLSGPGDGAVNVSGTFVKPYVSDFTLCGMTYCDNSAGQDFNANFSTPVISGITYGVTVQDRSGALGETAGLTDSCGGTSVFQQVDVYSGISQYYFSWTPPATTTPIACKLTASLSVNSVLADNFSAGVLVTPAPLASP